jgi:hypothetical protein
VGRDWVGTLEKVDVTAPMNSRFIEVIIRTSCDAGILGGLHHPSIDFNVYRIKSQPVNPFAI